MIGIKCTSVSHNVQQPVARTRKGSRAAVSGASCWHHTSSLESSARVKSWVLCLLPSARLGDSYTVPTPSRVFLQGICQTLAGLSLVHMPSEDPQRRWPNLSPGRLPSLHSRMGACPVSQTTMHHMFLGTQVAHGSHPKEGPVLGTWAVPLAP